MARPLRIEFDEALYHITARVIAGSESLRATLIAGGSWKLLRGLYRVSASKCTPTLFSQITFIF